MAWTWAFRAAWGAVAVAAGPAFADALSGSSRAVQAVASVGLWLGWVVVLGASLVPRASTLTVVRVGAPTVLFAAAVAAAATADVGVDDAVALGVGALAFALGLAPALADDFVDGSSYGAERRFALRTPGAMRLVLAPLAWVVGVALPAAGIVLLADSQWVLGAVLVVVGGLGAVWCVPALHRLSMRWLVFVPAGLVVHDRMALPEPVLLRRASVVRFGPALAGTPAVDLTGGAGGLALELLVDAPVDLAEGVVTDRCLVAPLRPGAVLAEAAGRRYPVATAEPTTSSPS
jgi:hypothetical protein